MKDIYTKILDDKGNLISKTDKEENITTYQYDSLNRLTNVINSTDQTNYVYDGRVAGRTLIY